MSQEFHLIATVLCKHPYFKDKMFRAIQFSIPQESAKLMNDLGILMKQISGGFNLYTANPNVLNTKNSLKIYLNCSDTYYINYTDLPEHSIHKNVYFFNNLNTHESALENSFFLQNTEYVGSNDLLPLGDGLIEIPNYNPQERYTFHDASNIQIPRTYFQETELNSGKYIALDVPEGIINIKRENQLIHSIYYIPNTVWKKPFAILELFTSSLYQDFKTSKKANYIINFNNRSTIWKYFLADPHYQNLQKLSIVNKENGSFFNSNKTQILHNNTEVRVFTLKEKLPLKEYTDDYFQLVENYNPEVRHGNVIINNLPNASPEQLFQEKTQDEKIIYYSHIYL